MEQQYFNRTEFFKHVMIDNTGAVSIATGAEPLGATVSVINRTDFYNRIKFDENNNLLVKVIGGSPEPPSGDPDATAYINNVLFNGGSLTTIQQDAVQTLFTNLKSDNLYSDLDAFWLILGGLSNTHKLNAKGNATYDLAYSGAWTHNSDGQKGNSSDTIALTNWLITSTNRHNYSFGIYVNNVINSGVTADIGVGIPEQGSYWFLAQYWDGYGSIYYAGDTLFNNAPQSSISAFLIGSRTTSDLYKGYNNGSIAITNTSLVSNSTSLDKSVCLGARNIDNLPSIPSGNNEIFAFVATGLSDAKVSSLYSIVNTFLTTIGRI